MVVKIPMIITIVSAAQTGTRSLLDRSFVSKLENYREPFRKIQFEKIMEQFKPGAKTEKKSDVWIPVRVDDK